MSKSYYLESQSSLCPLWARLECQRNSSCVICFRGQKLKPARVEKKARQGLTKCLKEKMN